jgi:hypothetical protein
MDENKIYWRRHEISIADYLMSHQDALRDDFMRGFNTLEEACRAQTSPVMKPWRLQDRLDRGFSPEEVAKSVTTTDNQPNLNGWRATPFRYERHDHIDVSFTAPEADMEKYPTARKLINEYGDNCPIASYSVLAPNTILQRHTGVENRNGEFIRIHIPLIIPEGDVFFEAGGEEIDWSDLWAFHNQFAHSAHNNTNEWRLVFLLDIRRTFIGLEPGMPYDIKNESTYMAPFVRKIKQNS